MIEAISMFARKLAGVSASLLALMIAKFALAEEPPRPPEPPTGYSWQELKEVSGAVLLPEGWHFRSVTHGDGYVYRVTKEKLAHDHAPFLAGLTLNVVRNVPQKTNVRPSLYAVNYVKNYLEGADVIQEPTLDEAAGMQRIVCQVVKKLPQVDPDKTFRLRITTMANDKTGTLYVLIFGSPQDEWDANYKIGKQLFNPLVLDRTQ